MNKNQFILSIVLASLLGGVVAMGTYRLLYKNDNAKTYVNIQPEKPLKFSNYTATNGVGAVDFVTAAEKTTPAVVHIKTYVEYTTSSRRYDPFQEFFRDFYGHRQRTPEPEERKKQERQSGSGSGVIISDDGYIVTNNHVIDGAAKIEVTLNDKRKFEAELIGTDPTTDLALLKVKEENLIYIDFGNSDKLRVGQWVVAVGNPFNLTSTVTAGIVSAKARNIGIINDKENLGIETFIQTDAAVNPGNSGGALVNLEGDLVGINSAIASPTGAFAGYSFAVPVEIVEKVVSDLKEYGEVQRALLGVAIADVTAELAEEKDIDLLKGVYIAGVNPSSAADEAGIQEGDVILKVNNIEVNNTSELQGTVARYRPGDEISVTYSRDGNVKEAKIILKNKLGTTKVVKKGAEMVVEILGASVKALSEKDKEKFNVENGVLIKSIDSGKFDDAGIKKGFVITHISKERPIVIESPSDLVSVMNSSQGEFIMVHGVYEDGRRVRYGVRP